ncbi:MAG TPA: TraR/DksA C4-type zinc finger protein [Pseudonocardiaceae bacterium]
MTRQFESVVESSTWTTHDDEHDPEGATVAFERAQIQALLRQARSDLDDLDRATTRLREGTYLRCERCGEDITEQRLAARPAASTCIGCAQRAR